jgi:hypothetical protein
LTFSWQTSGVLKTVSFLCQFLDSGPPTTSGSNPTIKSYNATSSLLRFENQNIFSSILKRHSSPLLRRRWSSKFRSRRSCSKAFFTVVELDFVFKTHQATRGLNFYNAGFVNRDRRIGSWVERHAADISGLWTLTKFDFLARFKLCQTALTFAHRRNTLAANSPIF